MTFSPFTAWTMQSAVTSSVHPAMTIALSVARAPTVTVLDRFMNGVTLTVRPYGLEKDLGPELFLKVELYTEVREN